MANGRASVPACRAITSTSLEVLEDEMPAMRFFARSAIKQWRIAIHGAHRKSRIYQRLAYESRFHDVSYAPKSTFFLHYNRDHSFHKGRAINQQGARQQIKPPIATSILHAKPNPWSTGVRRSQPCLHLSNQQKNPLQLKRKAQRRKLRQTMARSSSKMSTCLDKPLVSMRANTTR